MTTPAPWLGAERRHLPSCVSTMIEASAWASDGAPHGAVVSADHQSGGRGRRGKTWTSPAGAGVYLSMILRPDLPTERVPPITLAAGIGLCEAVNALGAGASLKWPNDLVVGPAKLAGILTEMSGDLQSGGAVIIGIGINVTQAPDSDRPTTCLCELGVNVGAGEVLGAMLRGIEPWLDRFVAGGVPAIADAWRQHAVLGTRVARSEPPLAGTAVGIDDTGALLVRDDRGRDHRVVAGELSWSS